MAESARIPDLGKPAGDTGPPRVSAMASALVGSEILRIAGEIRALTARGEAICDLTVGDFNPRHFPIPETLAASIHAALETQTNYPPADGVLDLREAVRRFYARELGLAYPTESVMIAGGSRPLIYAIFRTVCDPGDRVVYSVPSWNNNHYTHMVGGLGVPVACSAEHRFLPDRESLHALLPGARLLSLNSPLNPTGTAITPDALAGICDAVLEQNRRRDAVGERPLYLMYDQVYWMLCFGETQHVTPTALRPEMARYTVYVDGISKAFAATGLRVGWALGPPDLIGRMSAILGHVGAWAPRPEQVATARLLDDADAIRAFHARFKPGIERRLDLLHGGLQAMKAEGLPVDSIPPMGAMYLTARFHPFGRRTPGGAPLRTNDEVRRYLLEAARVGMVAFQVFGSPADDGWFRAS